MKTPREGSFLSPDAKIRLLENLRILQSFDHEEIEIIAEHSDWMSLQRGDSVLQGRAERLFVVFDGEVVILRKDEHGKEISLATFDKGRSF